MAKLISSLLTDADLYSGEMGFFGVIGWSPQWAGEGRSINSNAAGLRGLVGRVVEQVWGVWDVEEGQWIPDYPVVVSFTDGLQLEVCWQKFDELAIGWNSLVIDDRLMGDGVRSLQWRTLNVPGFDLSSVRDAEVVDVVAAETLFQWRGIGDHSAEVGERWFSAGLWLRAENGGIHIYNALDENGLDNEAVQDDRYRMVAVA
ncbi:MAG: hypothetical protein ACTHJI_00340 [Leifsonia sp.]